MSIVISNVFSDANIGGAAITAATVRAASGAFPEEDVRLVAVPTGPHDKSHPHTLRTFPDATIGDPILKPKGGSMSGARAVLRSLRILRTQPDSEPAVQRLKGAKAVVSKGGYVFHDRGSVGSLMALWLTTYPLSLGHAMGIPTAAVCTTVGPFKSEASRRLNRTILSKLDLLVPRDELSYREALALGLDPKKVVYLPDIVFSYPTPEAADRERMESELGVSGDRFIVLTLSETRGRTEDEHKQHEGNVAAALRTLLDEGWMDHVLMPIHASEDRRRTEAFIQRMNDPRVKLVPDGYSPEELMALYSGAVTLVARRMHSAIFSLVAGTPTVAFTMGGAKVQGVMGTLGLEDMLMPFPLDSSDTLITRLREMDSPDVRQRVLTAVDEVRQRVRTLPDVIRKHLRGTAA